MYEDIDEYVRNNPRLGYTSIPEFVKDAIRKNLGSTSGLSEITKTPIENIPVGSPLEHSILELYKLMNRPHYDPIKFSDVIQASTSRLVIPFDMTTNKEVVEVLERSLNYLSSPKTWPTDLSLVEYQTEYLKNQVTTDLKKSGMIVEELTGGGYPDLAVENIYHQTTYITLKVSTNGKYHKEFYFISSKKIREHGNHLLIEAYFVESPYKGIAHYCIRDLSTLVLVLDAEFRGSPKNIDKTTSVLAEFPTR